MNRSRKPLIIHKFYAKVIFSLISGVIIVSCGSGTSDNGNKYCSNLIAGSYTSSGTPIPGKASSSPLKHSVGNIVFDSHGNMYIANNIYVEKIDANGILSIIAGNGTRGTPVAGKATDSPLGEVNGITVDNNPGNVYVSDYSSNMVLKITPSGELSIFAGNGATGAPIAGPATSSPLNGPKGLAIDSSSNLYIADSNNNIIEKVTAEGVLSIIAGNGSAGAPVAGVATSSPLDSPISVAIDSSNNLYIADSSNHVIDKVTSEGILSIFAGNGTNGIPIAGVATSSPLEPLNLTVDSANNVYNAGIYVEKITPDGIMSIAMSTASPGFTGIAITPANVINVAGFPGGNDAGTSDFVCVLK